MKMIILIIICVVIICVMVKNPIPGVMKMLKKDDNKLSRYDSSGNTKSGTGAGTDTDGIFNKPRH